MSKRQEYTADFGYGGLKSDSGFTPMAVAETQTKNFDPNTMFKAEGKTFVFGEKAVDYAVSTLEGFRFFEKYLANIALLDMKRCGIDTSKPILIKTGITILDDVQGNLARFINILENIEEDGRKLDIRIDLYVQGQGVLYDYFNQAEENLSESGIVVVLDLGMRSFDCIVFENGQSLVEPSWADEIGANVIIKEFRDYLGSIGDDDSITEAEAISVFMSGKFSAFNENFDDEVQKKIDALSRKYVEQIANRLRDNDRKIFRKASKVIVAGGGANIVTPERLREHDPRMFSHAVTPSAPLNMSNYRGYKVGSGIQ